MDRSGRCCTHLLAVSKQHCSACGVIMTMRRDRTSWIPFRAAVMIQNAYIHSTHRHVSYYLGGPPPQSGTLTLTPVRAPDWLRTPAAEPRNTHSTERDYRACPASRQCARKSCYAALHRCSAYSIIGVLIGRLSASNSIGDLGNLKCSG